MKPAHPRLRPDRGPVTPATEHRLLLTADGLGELSGSLHSLTATTLTVRLANGAPEALAGAGHLAATVVSNGHAERFEDLVVQPGAAAGDDALVALGVLDPGSRGRLWDLWDRIAAGQEDLPGGHADVGDIPARGYYTDKARHERLRWIRAASGAPLGTLDEVRLDVRDLPGNIENVVGSVEVPVGLAGPLLFDGAHVQGRITVPLATTEGTLVASVTRGSRAITRSGGVRTQFLGQRMPRAPLYEFCDIRTAARFVRWVESSLPEISKQVGLVSRHAQLVEIWPLQIGRAVHLRFSYETADAAGQNMTTACTWQACQWINEAITHVPGLTALRFLIEANASGDKKVNYFSLIAGRGTRVTAECLLDRATVKEVLKTTPEAIVDTFRGCMQSSFQSGMLGNSINAANLVAALFTATGQDIASVHESSVAVFSPELMDGGLYASILLPALVVGTIGGGTGLPNQHDYLEMIGCAGAGRAQRYAEILAGFALALELSTLAAVAGGQFADAHERLGRNRPVDWLTREDLTPEFFTPLLAGALGDPGLLVTKVTEQSPVTGSSIISEITGQGVRSKLIGLLRLRLDSTSGPVEVVAKAKPLDMEVVLITNKIASFCGGRLAQLYSRWRDQTGFKDTHTRELGIYRSADGRLRDVMPRVYGIHEDPRREAYVLVLEDLGPDVILKDTTPDRAGWSERHVDAALRGIAQAHSVWLNRVPELASQPWLGHHLTSAGMAAMQDLWQALAQHNAAEYPEWIDEFTLLRIEKSIAELGLWWPELEAMPRTLVHNDFNPRNIALRADGLRLVAYDWELATIHVPQRDLAELLAFTMPRDVDAGRIAHHLEVHRTALEQAAGVELDPALWQRGYRLALRDFSLTRLQLYIMAHTQRQYDFLDDLVHMVKRLIRIEGERDISPW
jgi:NADP-dependent 3-hydroxy-3-methylglutaryl-CoA reductase